MHERVKAEHDETLAQADQREAAEVAIDGDLALIPAAHRAAVVGQLFIALDQHEFLDRDVADREAQLRAIATRLALPYLELDCAAMTQTIGPEVVRSDLHEWVTWCERYAPERLAAGKALA